MRKNRIIHIEDVKPSEFDIIQYKRFKEREHIEVDFHDLGNVIKNYLNDTEQNILLTHVLDGEEFGHISMRLGVTQRKARRIYKKAVREIQKYYKKHGGNKWVS